MRTSAFVGGLFITFLLGCDTQSPIPASDKRTTARVAVTKADDFLQIYTNGLFRGSVVYGSENQMGMIDLTDWLVDGNNEIRVTAYNTGGGMAAFFKLWVDDKLRLDVEDADSSQAPGQFYDHSELIDCTGHGNKIVAVSVESDVTGDVYINGHYSGFTTPTVLRLVEGNYQFGIGGINDRYKVLNLHIDDTNNAVHFEDDEWLPPRAWKILLVAVRKMNLGKRGNNQETSLTDQDIELARQHLEVARSKWIEPLSFGLVTWTIEQLVVEGTIGHVPDDDDQIDAARLLEEAHLDFLKSQFDCLVYFWPEIAPDGSDPLGCCRAVGGGEGISVSNNWIRRSDQFPHEVFLHEFLHVAEQSYFKKGFYNGLNGLHGAEEHGFQEVDGSWVHWYRIFMRGQVAEPGPFYVGIPPEAWINSTRVTSE